IKPWFATAPAMSAAMTAAPGNLPNRGAVIRLVDCDWPSLCRPVSLAFHFSRRASSDMEVAGVELVGRDQLEVDRPLRSQAQQAAAVAVRPQGRGNLGRGRPVLGAGE